MRNKFTGAGMCILLLLLQGLFGYVKGQAPVNDDCINPSVINISNAGYGLGIFNSDTIDLSNGTVQTGESFAAAIFVAGQDKKSIWYKFTLPTIRSVRVTLSQPGVTIAAGNAGFAVYKTNNCLPGTPDISTKLTPIATFGNSLHPCTDAGEYLIQVSSNFSANGPVFIQLELSDLTGALYDRPVSPYSFGVASNYARYVDLNTECHSLEDSSEVCNALFNKTDYQKSAWFTFRTSTYFDYMSILLSGTNGAYFTSPNRTFGYTLYKGDAATTPVSSLVTVDGCDSLTSDGYYAGYKTYRCGDLDTNTVYTIQLIFHKDFKENLRLGIITGGTRPTNAPEPSLSMVPAPNAVGILPATPNGTTTTIDDVFGCNSRHSIRSCNPGVPDTGIDIGGRRFNLSSFITFSLASTSAVSFYLANSQCGPQPVMRLFKQGLTSNCNDLDTVNFYTILYNGSRRIDCLPPGDYTLQVMGTDDINSYQAFNYGSPLYNYEQCQFSNLGAGFRVNLTAYTLNASNQFSLATLNAYDTINNLAGVMTPIVNGGSYQAAADTFGCLNTVRPADTTCQPNNNKVMYREFNVADSGVLTFTALSYPLEYKLYEGDAGALATAQNVFAYPDTISGLKPRTLCLDAYTYCNGKRVCMVPGTYTLTSFANETEVGVGDRPSFTFSMGSTLHKDPLNAQDMGSIIDTLGPSGGQINSDLDYWDCRDNADTINGYAPCTIGGAPATKAIYRQFYLKEPALVSIMNIYAPYCTNYNFGYKTLFKGKATDGLDSLTPVGGQWSCFQNASPTNGCSPLDSGWYTVVSYGVGPTFDNPFQAVNSYGGYGSYVGYQDQFYINITITCKGPQFNRPFKASIDTATGQPYLVQWGNRIGNTAAYPFTDTTITLQQEFFNCTIDTPFANHPINSCTQNLNRVVYYVFRTTQESYVQIDTKGFYGVLYNKDVRVDSLQFTSLSPIQPCLMSNGHIQICKMQPGTYTLVIFAGDANSCGSVQPTIYIDKVGYSRFDFARNAYDFGVVAPDSVYHYGKTGDVNPLNAGRKPSNDFFYCTTGAFTSDPIESACDAVNPKVYNTGVNVRMWDSTLLPSYGVMPRRNLWYTFVVTQPGYVKVKVENKTIGKGYQYRFAVYKSNVNGTLPFTTVVSSGQVDSTIAQGLTLITYNYPSYYCYNAPNEVSFYRDPCSNLTERYYLVVDNSNSYPYEIPGMKPNSQAEVSVLIDSLTLVLPKFDHYYQANNLGAINTSTITRGALDNYTCATRDATDPTYAYGASAGKTLWYKFTTNLSGNVRYRLKVNGVDQIQLYQVQLFRQVIPGDSTSTGLIIQNTAGSYIYDGATNSYWANTCVSPGTYYVFATGYSQLNEYVYPEVQVMEQLGDYCSKPIPTALTGPGTASGSMLVNCHTIGTDYGEFGPQLTCPVGASTNDYKSSWFRLDISGSDVLDVTAYLVENTNASSSDIKYRLMTGNCGAMQEQSCVLDALTQNTYQCLVPGQSYYVQVFTPIVKNGQPVTGDIELKLSAIKHTDTCAPLTSCLATANFITSFNCTTDRTVKFVNFSTYGTDITYLWNFGYNNQTSAAVSPTFLYPATATDQNYTVKLLVINASCGKRDSVTRVITVPGRPLVNFGADRVQCNGLPVTLNATSFAGATYAWQDGSSNPTFSAATGGSNAYHVTVTYNNCIARDTINVLINPIIKRATQNFLLCAANDSVQLDAYRGNGETYLWNNGRTTSAIYVRNPGTYWVNVRYATCTIRDSFVVGSTGTLRPLGRDTLVCLRAGSYQLNATTNGATGYSWQNGSTSPTFNVTAAGLYWVDIRFAACSVRDSIRITNYAAPVVQTSTAAICSGNSYTLPWGNSVSTSGTYRDTLRYTGGCDSVYRVVTLTVRAKPSLGIDKSVSICQGASLALSSQFTTTGLTSVWSLGALTVTGNLVSTAGQYQLIATNGFGCSDTALLTLTVNPKPSLGRDTSISICPFFTADLTTIYNTGSLTTAWTLNGVAVANPAAVTAAGNYRLIATTSLGCSDTAFVTLVRLIKPALGVDKPAKVCPGFTTDITLLYNTSSLTSAWSFGGSSIAAPVSASAAGGYQLIATNASGCSDTALVTLSINPKPAVGNDTSVVRCSGNSVNLTSLYVTAGLNAAWTNSGTPVVPATAVRVAGQYELIVRNSAGCEDTALVNVTINPKPTLGNDTSVRICPGFTTDLTQLYMTTGLTTSWSIGTTAVTNPSGIGTAGRYRLIAVNSFGCSDTAFVTVIVNAKPALGADKSVSICPGFTADVAALYNVSGLTPQWTVAGLPVTDSSSAGVAGIYQLIATNSSGCSDTALVTVTILPKPSVGTDTTVHVCPGYSVDLRSLYNTTGLTSLWQFNTATVSNPSAVTNGGVYTLIVTNASGCKDTALVTVIVDPKPALGIDQLVSVCPGFAADLTALYSTTSLSAQWTIGGTVVATPNNVFNPGNYQLIVINAFGCSDTATAALSFYAKPALGNDTAIGICPGFTGDLTGLYNTNGLVINWSLAGQPVVDPASVAAAGVYRLIVTNSSGCSDTALVTLSILPKPNIGADLTVHICPGFTTDLTVLYSTTGLTTTWTFGGAAVANATSVGAGGAYQLVVSNANGCNDTALVTVIVDPKPALGADQTINFCPGFSANLTTLYTTTGFTTAWTLAGNPVANPAGINVAGNYQLIVTNAFGCTDTSVVAAGIFIKPSLGADQTAGFCPGFSTDLTTVYTTSGLTPVWTLNGVIVADATQVNVAGNYRLIATNSSGCSDTAFVLVTRYVKPSLGADKNITICNGASVDLTTQFNFSNLTPGWTNSGVVVTNASAITIAGNYQVIATSVNGCADTAFVLINVNPKPFAGADTTIKICPGAALNLRGVYNTSNLQSSWTFGGVAVGNLASVNADGVYRLVVTNSFGCTDTSLVTLITDVNPLLVINNPATICYPDSVDIAAPAVTAGSVTGIVLSYWYNSNGTGGIPNPSAVADGVYYIKATNITGCITIKPVTATILPLITANAGADITVCKGNQGILQGSVTNASGSVSYLWTPDTGLGVATSAVTTVNPDTTRTYVLNVTDNYGCNFSVFDSVIVTVPPPVPAFAGNDTIVSTGLPHQLLATGGVGYQWKPENLLNNPFISNPMTTLFADSVLFTVIVTDADGCIGYDSVKVKTLDGITYYVPNAFSPDGNGTNDFFKPIPVGIVSTEYFRIFNRLGETVFLSNNIGKGWDGTYKGKPQQPANYVWVLKGKGRNGKVVEMKGNVVLVR